MELEYAFLAASAHFDENSRLFAMGGGIDAVKAPPALPATAANPFSLVVRLTFPPEECGREYVLSARISAPDGSTEDIIDPARFTPAVPAPESLLRRTKVSFVMSFVAFTFSAYGLNTIHLFIDGEEIKRLPLLVEREAPAQGQGAPAT
jgi:hypothetical protein